jgi:DNA-binding transcriptional ArsR family regulator
MSISASRRDGDERHAEGFGALANHTRLRILAVLSAASAEVSAGAIRQSVGVPAATLSHHLHILREAGLIQSRREQRHIYYSIERHQVSELAKILADCI